MWTTDSWKRPWCWERLKAGGEGDDRGWHGWMASPTWWTWVWASSGSWGWPGKPGVLCSPWGHKELDMTKRLNWLSGTSSVVQWLRLRLPTQRGMDLIPAQGAKIPQASQQKKEKKNTQNWNIKQKQYCNKFNKAFKRSTLKKKLIKNSYNIMAIFPCAIQYILIAYLFYT